MSPVIGLLVALGVLLSPLATEAQQPAKMPRIGYLGFGMSTPENAAVYEPFRQGLRDLGYVEGQNVAIEWRFAEGRPERLPDLARELVRLKVDVIVVPVTSAALAARNATRTIPIVMVAVPDPIGAGLVQSLARPGGNVTGLSFLNPELSAKQLQLLKEVVPKVSRVAVLQDPASVGHRIILKEAEATARALGVELQILGARVPDDFDAAFAAMTRERAGALLVLAHPTFLLYRRRLADLAEKGRLPAMYGNTEHAEAGGLMAYAPSLADNFRRSAVYVDKILKGAKPSDLPVEQPTRFQLVVNLKAAQALGLTIPQSVLIRSDRVVQ